METLPHGTFHYSNDVKVSLIAGGFILYQNYPNPFNSTTLLKYDIPAQSSISLYIYNSIGEQVEVFNEGLKKAGKYSITWNPGNLSSGVYFCFLNAVSSDGISHIRKSLKMVLMK
ncbi:MAG TPA: T9SS type A sorting domain-containing protein [Ignavibacteriaceae bacterium]|nr:T9SS type A sorting domain-containing protein [Ignavibacteriaceae bacterium]